MAGLLDFLQSASNAAASNISGPVDGLAWLLGKAGMPVQNPVGGSAWMERMGLTKPVQQSGASLAGETFGLAAPIAAAAKAPQIARGLLSLDDAAKAQIGRQTEGYMQKSGLMQYAKAPEYQGMHKPPGRDAASLHDLTSNGVYPADVYGMNGSRYYGDGSGRDNSAFALASMVKGKPDATVTIYRAVPYEKTAAEKAAIIQKQKDAYMRRRIVPPEWGGSSKSIGDEKGFYEWATKELERLAAEPATAAPKIGLNAGDWVTLSKEYAKEHGQGALGGNYKIISKKVKAKDLFTNGDSIQEWGYWPEAMK